MADIEKAIGTGSQFPLVTIMIPTYCQEQVVTEALDSALSQDYPNLEVIVVDDASPDNTASKISARQDSRLRYHRNPVNVGRVANYRNALYNLARGDWVVNLDGDDYYTDTGFISAAIRQALADPEILLVSARVNTLGGMNKRTTTCSDSSVIMSGCQALYQFVISKFPLFHMASLYRRQEALRSDFYHVDTLSSDTESLWRLAVQGKVSYLDRDVGIWRVTGSSASRTQDWKRRVDDLDIWPAVFREAVACGMSPALAEAAQQRAVAVWAYNHLSMLAMSGQWAALRKYMRALSRRIGVSDAFFIATRWRLCARMLWGCLHGRSRLHSRTPRQ